MLQKGIEEEESTLVLDTRLFPEGVEIGNTFDLTYLYRKAIAVEKRERSGGVTEVVLQLQSQPIITVMPTVVSEDMKKKINKMI